MSHFLGEIIFFAACNILIMVCNGLLIVHIILIFSNGKAEILTKLQTSCHPISVFFRYVIIIVK